jgi:transcriptional regulator with XRE-family HTH domain
MNTENRALMGARLRLERERLELLQPDMAALGDVKPRTYQDWERGVAGVSAEFLAVVAAHGVDVLYVVTGERSGSASLSQAESELLTRLRQGSPVLRGYLQEVSAAPAAGGGTVTIGGDVGQQVNGNQTVTAPMTFNLGKGRK